MEFKGTKEKWKCVFTSDLKRAVRSKTGILMTFWKPSKYCGQDERYEAELKETQSNQLLCSMALEMLDMLQKVNQSLLNDYATLEQIKLRKEVEKLIKEATEI